MGPSLNTKKKAKQTNKKTSKDFFFQLNETESDLVKKCGEPLVVVNMGDRPAGAERGNSSKVNKRCAGT